jgi:hypothetical protein
VDPESEPVDARDAAEIARRYLVDLLGDQYEVRLEEVEIAEDDKYWLVTLSYSTSPLRSLREYKIFKIEARTGKVLYMRIRSIK